MPYVFPTPAMTQGMPPTPGRRDARPGRAVRLRHDDARRPRHLGGGPRRRRLRPHRRRPRDRSSSVERSRDHGVRALPTARPPRHPPGVRRLLLPQQRGRRRAGAARRRPRPGRGRRPRRPPRQRHAGDLLGPLRRRSTPRPTSTRAPGGSRTSSATPHETGSGDGDGRHASTCPLAEGTGDARLARRGRAPGRARRRQPTPWSSPSASTRPPTTPRARCWSRPTATPRPAACSGPSACRRWSSRRAATTCPASVASSRPTSTDTPPADGSGPTAP